MTTTSSPCTENTNKTLQETKKDSGRGDTAINVTVISSLLIVDAKDQHGPRINVQCTLMYLESTPQTPSCCRKYSIKQQMSINQHLKIVHHMPFFWAIFVKTFNDQLFMEISDPRVKEAEKKKILSVNRMLCGWAYGSYFHFHSVCELHYQRRQNLGNAVC